MAKNKSTRTERKSSFPKALASDERSSDSKSRVVDLDIIKSIADVSQILDIATMHFSALARRPLAGRNAQAFGQEVSVRASRIKETPEPVVLATVDFQFTAVSNLVESEPDCEIHGTMMVAYHLSVPVSTFSVDALNMFAEVNGIYSAWPYIRELVGSTAARLGLGGVTLPRWAVPSIRPPEGEYHTIAFTPPATGTSES